MKPKKTNGVNREKWCRIFCPNGKCLLGLAWVFWIGAPPERQGVNALLHDEAAPTLLKAAPGQTDSILQFRMKTGKMQCNVTCILFALSFSFARLSQECLRACHSPINSAFIGNGKVTQT